jgi:hypothetical protein
MAVTASTKITGSIVTSFAKAFTSGTQFNATTKMKYRLAKRWNCSNRFFGTNVSQEYLLVLIRLERYP